MNWKALVTGFIFIIGLGLLMQLAFIFISVGYITLGRTFPFLAPYSDIFLQFSVILGLFITSMTGGYLTALIAERKPRVHAAIAGGAACFLSLLFSRSAGEFTLTSVIFLSFGIAFAILGGWFRNKQQDAIANPH